MNPSSPHPVLLLNDGPRQEEIAVTHTPFTIGRLPDRDLCLLHPFLSRNHAEIILQDGQLSIADCGSRHGTFVNEQRVDRRRLATGDEIRLGSLQGPSLRVIAEREGTTTIHRLLEELHAIQSPTSELEKLSWFMQAAHRLNTLGAVDEILTSLVEATLELTRVERGYVFLKGADGELKLSVGRNQKGVTLADDSTVSRSAIRQATTSASKFIVTDTLSAEAGSPSTSIVQQSIRTVYCIPLRKRSAEPGATDKEILGVLYLDSRLQPGRLTQVDNDLLETIATEAAALVENAMLARAEEASRRYQEELKVAATIQQGLMAVDIPHLPYASICARSVACKEVGGDFFDVVATASGLYIVVADISGKGVSAAILASTLQGLLYGQVLAEQPLAQMAELANRYICAKNVRKHATMVLLKLAPDGTLEYINCGHVQPLLISSGSVERLQNGNLLVGLLPEATFAAETMRLQPGQRLLIVTDGITEAENGQGEFYGEQRLESAASNASIDDLMQQLARFMDGAAANDDCTLLEVQYGAEDACGRPAAPA